jgi:hypothetical protein
MDKATCREGDGNPVLARGWCSRCYQAAKAHDGDPHAGGPRKTGRERSKCKIETCPEPVAGQGWCGTHYSNFRRHGDPEWTPEGTQHRRYDLDDSFFDNVDTEAKAYWLGFINADGCVQAGAIGTAGWQRHSLYVKLMASDSGHLEKMKADMSAESPVFVHPQRGNTEITLSSMHLVESLIRLGVTPRKSLTATPWDGPDHLMRHYWRGMVDGDGTIVKHSDRDNKWQLRLIGSRAVVEAFRAWAAPICGSSAKVYPKVNIFSWTAGGLASPQALARELYAGSTVYLDRKYELANQLMAAPILRRERDGSQCSAGNCEAEAEVKGMCRKDYGNKLRREDRAAGRAERAA